MNKFCSYKTICANTIESGFPFVGDSPPRVGDVEPTWVNNYLCILY